MTIIGDSSCKNPFFPGFSLSLLDFFYTFEKKFVAGLYGFCLINIIVDEVRFNDIFQINVDISQIIRGLLEILKKKLISFILSGCISK